MLCCILFAVSLFVGCGTEKDWLFDRIEILSLPAKTTYYAGELFDAEGMKVNAVWKDASGGEEKTADVSAAVAVPAEPLEEGQTEVVVSYTEGGVTKSASVAVTVGKAPEYGTLTIGDAYLYNISPSTTLMISFSEPEYADEEITYAFVSDQISIRGDTAMLTKSVSAASVIEVKATTKYHSTTFTVSLASSFTDHDTQAELRKSDIMRRYENGTYRDGGVLFAGDSFFDTEFWTDFYTDYAGKNAALIGIGGSRADEWPVFVERLFYPYNPSAIVLNLGTNDLLTNTPQQDAEELKTLFLRIHETMPSTQVCWYTIVPRNGMNITSIKSVNALIEEWSADKEWFTFMDAHPAFCDDNGVPVWNRLKDGIHPQLEYYNSVYMALLDEAGIEVPEL